MSKVLDAILGVFSNDLAIDLGTANTCVYARELFCANPRW